MDRSQTRPIPPATDRRSPNWIRFAAGPGASGFLFQWTVVAPIPILTKAVIPCNK